VSAASGAAGVAPGAWVSIYGTNMATAVVSAATSDLVNGYLPTTLGGVTVTIDGAAAYLNYVSPTQINLQAPSSSSTGTVTVTVSNSSGSSSASVTMQTLQPGLFTSNYYVLAVRPLDSVIINGSGGAVSGYTTAAAAAPGDALEIYGTGFGATSTGVLPGLVFSGAYPTVNSPTVTIGGSPATVLYCGLIGAGLYQINVIVPSALASGTYPVVATQDGVSSPASALMRIAVK
jgi:uncharacterized protein (TIGR03437 family)